MKKLFKLFAAVVVGSLAFACTTDTTEDLGVKVEGQGGVYEVAISLEATKTQLGEKVDGLYPLHWSEGDAISINGIVSNPLTAGGSANAYFTFNEPVTRPYCVVYPAAEGAGEGTVYPVTFASTQPYTEGTFASGVAPMYGYGAELAEGETETPIQLNHLTGVLRLAVKGNGEKVTSVVVKAEKGYIAGPHTVDCATGALTALEGATSNVTVTCGDGLVLGSEATPIFLTVPAGSYGTFVISINTEAHGKMTVKFNSDTKAIAAGVVREFSEVAYEANANDSEEVFEIDSKEALIEFARIAGTFYPRTKAIVTADIDMTGYDWKSIEGFGAFEFDGGEFAIKGLNAPLFGTTAATIKNLKLTDVNIVETEAHVCGGESYVHSGAIAYRLIGGSLDNCYTSGNITVNNTTYDRATALGYYHDVCLGGMVGFINEGSLTNCENHVNLTINSTWKEEPTSTLQLVAGAMFGVVDGGVTIKECDNYGAITVNTALKNNKHVVVGGVLGATSYQGDVKSITYCENHGAITISESFTTQYDYWVGGVAGYIHKGSENISNLTNLGAINIAGNAINDAEIEVAGVLAYSEDSFSHLVNGSEEDATKGAINVTSASGTNLPNDKTYIAGVAVRSGESVSNCTNYGKLSVTGKSGDNTYVGGILGSVYSAAPKTLSNCENYGEIYYGRASSKVLYIGGIISQSWNSSKNESTTTISDCEQKGNIVVDIKSGAGIGNKYIGGIFGYHANATDCGGVKTFIFNDVKYSGNLYYADLGSTSEGFIGGFIGTAAGQKNLEYNECVSSGNVYIGYTKSSASNEAQELSGATIGGKIKLSLFAGGWAGTYNKATNCTVSGDLKINSQFTTTDQVHVAGFGGYGGNPFDVEGCTFAGTIEFNANSKTAAALHLGGYFGYYNDSATTITENVIKECTVSKEAKIIMAGNCGNELRMGGIIAWMKKNARPMSLYGCSNYGTIELASTAKTASTTAIGGLIGKPEAKTVNFVGCWNEGNFNIDGNSLKNLCVGGLVGNNYSGVITAGTSTEYPKFYNKGNIVIGNTAVNGTQMSATAYVIAGGFVGYNQKAYTINNSFTNTGNITVNNVKVATNFYVGGCLGYSNKADVIGSEVELINTGNISITNTEFVKADGSFAIGGISSKPAMPLANCKSYCNIKVIPELLHGKAGMIMGIARADATKATNCYIGGNIYLEKTGEEWNDPYAEDYKIPIYGPGAITASNWFEHIYGTAITEAQAKTDGCDLLTAVPTIQ